MRSSIACSKCRRSKIKCVNNGVGTICRDCEQKGRECTYPSSIPGGAVLVASKREGSVPRSLNDMSVNGEAPKRSRPKKQGQSGSVTTKESMRAFVDALDPSLLTPKVWIEVLDLFQRHYALDLPFIHTPTFEKPLRMRRPDVPPNHDFNTPAEKTASPMPEATPLILLGILALTAKFHKTLVEHHSPPSASRPSNPLIASEYYAAACRARLAGNHGDNLGTPDLPRIGALIMLATHEWVVGQGVRSYVSLGVALRYLNASGIQYQADLDDQPLSYGRSTLDFSDQRDLVTNRRLVTVSADEAGKDFIEAEIRRRYVWAAFTLDRYLSSGKFRPQAILLSNLHIQLPSSENTFLRGRPVRTARLSTDGLIYPTEPQDQAYDTDKYGYSSEHGRIRGEFGYDEGLLSRYVRAVDLYGKIMQWSCRGGSRCEKSGPTDPSSTWNQLQRQLNDMMESLPKEIRFSSANLSVHLSSKTATQYMQMHVLLMLCKLILSRDLLQFAPLEPSRPRAPSNLPRTAHGATHPDFCEANAENTFRTARELIDLTYTCMEWQEWVQTPLMGFAVYVAALTGLYSMHFPTRDLEGWLCETPTRPGDYRGPETVRKAFDLVSQFRPVTKMANSWMKTLIKTHKYYTKVKRTYHQHSQRSAMVPPPYQSEPRYSDAIVGGFESTSQPARELEQVLLGYSETVDEDVQMMDAPEVESATALSSNESTSGAGKSEGLQPSYTQSPEAQAIHRPGAWQAVNNGGPIAASSSSTHAPETTTNNRQSLQSILCDQSPDDPLDWRRRQQQGPPESPSFKQEPNTQASFPNNPYDAPSTNRLPPLGAGAGTPSFANQRLSSHGYQSPSTTMSVSSIPSPRLSHGTEPREAWSRLLDLSFGGEDVAAFVEGRDLGYGAPEGGWLARVWNVKGGAMPF